MPLTIQLQNADRSPRCYIGMSQMQEMQRTGQVDVFTKGKNFIARLRPKVEPSRSGPSKPSITYSDVLANVGLMDRPHSTLELSRGRMIRAQEKIAAFGASRLLCTHPQHASEPVGALTNNGSNGKVEL